MKSREVELDSLRGIACLIVIAAHLLVTDIGINVSGCGKIGVWCFYVLAGFFSMLPFVENKYEINDVIPYFIKRIIRIYPAYLLVLVTCAFVKYMTNGNAVRHLMLLKGETHFWSIPVEMKMYMLIPFILIIATEILRNHKELVLVVMLLISIIAFPYNQYVENSISIKWYLPVFIIGMLCAILYKKQSLEKNIVYDIVVLVVVLCMVISVPGIRYKLFGIPADGYLQNKYLYFAIGWGIILLCLRKTKYIGICLKKASWLQWIGKISYSLYLVHYIVLFYVNKHVHIIYLKYILVIVCSVVIAYLIKKCVEDPFNKLGQTVVTKIINKQIKRIYSIITASLAILLCCLFELMLK